MLFRSVGVTRGRFHKLILTTAFYCGRSTARVCIYILWHLADAFIQSDLQQFIHRVSYRRQSQPHRATASSSGAVRVKFLSQADLDKKLGGQTSNLPVTSQPALPPEFFSLRVPNLQGPPVVSQRCGSNSVSSISISFTISYYYDYDFRNHQLL